MYTHKDRAFVTFAFCRQTGIIIFGNPDVPELVQTIQSLEENQVAHEVFSGEEANKKYPQLKIPAEYMCVFEKDGGILLADKALAAFQVTSQS